MCVELAGMGRMPPMRGRELKLRCRGVHGDFSFDAPYAGARIETFCPLIYSDNGMDAPYAGARIETDSAGMRPFADV